jgi:hypothetical protein
VPCTDRCPDPAAGRVLARAFVDRATDERAGIARNTAFSGTVASPGC